MGNVNKGAKKFLKPSAGVKTVKAEKFKQHKRTKALSRIISRLNSKEVQELAEF